MKRLGGSYTCSCGTFHRSTTKCDCKKKYREILFITNISEYLEEYLYFEDTIKAINDKKNKFVVTSQLNLLNFNLFDEGFTNIFLKHKGCVHELKLGENLWTKKELRKEHNLLKLVTSNILK